MSQEAKTYETTQTPASLKCFLRVFGTPKLEDAAPAAAVPSGAAAVGIHLLGDHLLGVRGVQRLPVPGVLRQRTGTEATKRRKSVRSQAFLQEIFSQYVFVEMEVYI